MTTPRRRLASAKVEGRRYAALLTQNAIAPQDNDDAKAAYGWRRQCPERRTHQSRLYPHHRAHHRAHRRLQRHAGALVTADQTTALATISTLDPIYVDIDQSSSELLALKRQRRRPAC